MKKEETGAEFSKCGKHRLSLWRIWDREKAFIAFIGLNPSTANASSDDPTIRRVTSIAKELGYGGIYMLNLFTYISTDPKKLNVYEGNLPESNTCMIEATNKCSTVIFAWGNFKVFGRDIEVGKMYKYAKALHINKNGSPKHPLYCKTNIQPVLYDNTIRL